MSDEKLKIYIKPTCTTCRKALKILREEGAEFSAVNYFEEPLTRKELTGLIEKLGVPARELLRKNEKIYKELGLSKKELSEKEIIDLLVRYPDLLQRPIVRKGGRVILARPAEKIEKLI
ncbi:MAG: ArsC/Spx/MgsR family protein [Deltaproteobacteria bacterium]